MTVADLQTLFDYGYWANAKLFPVIAQLMTEQFIEPLPGTQSAIRDKLVHMLSAEWGWLDRCGGTPRGAPLNPADYPTLAKVVDAWIRVERYLRDFLSTLHDEDLTRIINFTIGGSDRRSMPLGELLQHATNHGVHHRGQVSLHLRLLGYSPENFDLLLYFAEKHRTEHP